MKTVTAHRYFAGFSRNTFLLASASLFADISTEMIYPVLPIFLTQILKAGGTAVGLVEGVAGATQNIVQGFSGSLSDKLQRRKPIALVGYTIVGLCDLVASLIAGWLWDQVGHASVFLFGAAFAVVGGVALLALVPANLKHDAATAR